MEPCGPGVVRDTNLGAQARELVQRAPLRRAHVRCGDDPERAASLAQVRRERVANADIARPFHERAEQIDAIRRVELGDDLGADAVLARSIDQERRLRERDAGARGLGRLDESVAREAGEEQVRCHEVGRDAVLGERRGDQLEDAVGEIDLRERALLLGDDTERALEDAVHVAREDDVSLRGIDREPLDLGAVPALERAEARLERMADEALVEATD